MILGSKVETYAAPGRVSSDGVDGRMAQLSRGEEVDRYVVLSKLGAGGMGIVYAAYDPELDRKVALKLMRSAPGGSGSGGASRLLREAQALAQLSHPNVVAVHDVGTRGDAVWVAMDFIAGRTLEQWMAERRHTWREVMAVMQPVAAGLAAAHAAGLVHRDIKPANVMLGDDGRVRVMDFGLARGSRREPSDPAQEEVLASLSMRSRMALEVTRLGELVGTPAYMAPEQLSGADTDERTDQFSLCVTLWEALYGQRPFAGESLAELATNVLEGRPGTPPRGVSVPRWLRRVVLRGLSVLPDERWPSIPALQLALHKGRAGARATKTTVSVMGLGVVGALVWGQRALDEHARTAACEAEGAALHEVWNPEVREEVRASLLATGAGYAATTADKVMPWLDRQADAWRDARTEACLDTQVRGVWDDDLLQRSVWCLDQRRHGFVALVDLLRDSNVRAVGSAVEAAAELKPVEPCRDAALLARLPAPPDRARDEVEAVRSAVSRAAALESTGAYDEALATAREALAGAESVGWPPLIAEARVVVGNQLAATGEYAEAEKTLEAGYFDAVRAGAERVQLDAALFLAHLVGNELARGADGERWAKHAEGIQLSLPDPTGLGEAARLDRLAVVRHAAGDADEAAELYARSLELRRAALGDEHPQVAAILNNLAVARRGAGALEEAAELHEEALAIREAALGPDHPEVADSLGNLAVARSELGEDRAAIDLFARALEVREAALGPDHPAVARNVSNLAKAYEAIGDYAEALRLDERAVAALERSLGPDHPDVATALGNLASVQRKVGRFDDAIELRERALAIYEATLGFDHPRVGATLCNLGEVYLDQQDFEEAGRCYERALALFEKSLGPDHPLVAHALTGLARVASGLGRFAEAVPWAERAVQQREQRDGSPAELAAMQMLLARALVGSGGSRARAVELAEQARDGYRQGGDLYDEMVREVDAWLIDQRDR